MIIQLQAEVRDVGWAAPTMSLAHERRWARPTLPFAATSFRCRCHGRSIVVTIFAAIEASFAIVVILLQLAFFPLEPLVAGA